MVPARFGAKESSRRQGGYHMMEVVARICPVHLVCSRFVVSVVQMFGSSSSTWLSRLEPAAESGECGVVSWLHDSMQRRDLPQQRPEPHDLGARAHFTRVRSFAVGSVDQQRRPVRVFVHQSHDPVIRSIPAAMSSVDHSEAVGRRAARRLVPAFCSASPFALPRNRSESTCYHADRRPICGLNC